MRKFGNCANVSFLFFDGFTYFGVGWNTKSKCCPSVRYDFNSLIYVDSYAWKNRREKIGPIFMYQKLDWEKPYWFSEFHLRNLRICVKCSVFLTRHYRTKFRVNVHNVGCLKRIILKFIKNFYNSNEHIFAFSYL